MNKPRAISPHAVTLSDHLSLLLWLIQCHVGTNNQHDVHLRDSAFNTRWSKKRANGHCMSKTYQQLEMWANAQRDGRPAEYTWRPLFNAAKFDWHPLLECRAVTLPRCETRWNLQGCAKLANRSQPLVGRSSPYYQDMCGRYCCLTSFFPTVDTCLSSEDIARQSCAMEPNWRFFCVLYFQRAACSPLQTCILNSH